MKNISILIADDHKIVRMGLKSLFKSAQGFTVVGEAEDGNVAVSQALALKPDIVIMDLMMPNRDGVSATQEIHDKLPNTKIIVLTSYSTSDAIAAALSNGASGAVMKSVDDNGLLATVRTVAAGETFISPEVRGLLDIDPPVRALSPRQLDVLDAIVKGFTSSEIATRLDITRGVVKEHVAVILEKLGASNRAEAVAIALRKQLVKP